MIPRHPASGRLVPVRRVRRAGALLLASALIAALVRPGLGAPAAGDSAASPASPTPAPAAGVPAFEHVIVVVMENKDFDQARNPKSCPYTADLMRAGAWFSDYHAITHPSQPNYLALWAGNTLGVGDNSCPPHGAPFAAENLGHALEATGKTWRAYSEDLPGAGSAVCKARGKLYTRKHEPWTHFKNLDHSNERPYSDLAKDIAEHRLPDLAFVVPNNCHNTHDCSISTGDAWLAEELPAMITGVGRNGLVVLTWDEDDDTSDNHILTVFAGLMLRPATVSTRHVTHYTLLRTLCDGLGLVPFGNATQERPITDVWYRAATPADPK